MTARPDTWVDLPLLFDLDDSYLHALLHGFREAGIEHQLQAVMTSVGPTRGNHQHALRVRSDHAPMAARLILALSWPDGECDETPVECPACGAATKNALRCPSCELNFESASEHLLLAFVREHIDRSAG